MTEHARFGVRPASFGTASGSGDGFGVWDAAVNGWHGPSDLTRDEAQQRAATVEADYRAAIAARAARGVERRADHHTRQVDPAKDVEFQLDDDAPWIPGRLHTWHRDNGTWYGEVSVADTRKPIWVEQDYLREPKAQPKAQRKAQRTALAASDGS